MTRFIFKSILFSIVLTVLLLFLLIQYLQTVSHSTQQQTNAMRLDSSLNSQDMVLHFINLDIGKTILIQMDERGVLIDVGHKKDTDKLLAYLKEAKIQIISDIFLSNPAEETMGGILPVLEHFPTANVYVPKLTLNKYPAYLHKRVKVTNPGDVIDLSKSKEINLEVLGPIPPAFHHQNNDSLTSLIHYQDIRILLMSDIYEPAETRLVKAYPDLRAEIMTVPDRPTGVTHSQSLIHRINPQTAIMLEVPCEGCKEVIDIAEKRYSNEWSDFSYVPIGKRYLMYFKDGAYTTESDQPTLEE